MNERDKDRWSRRKKTERQMELKHKDIKIGVIKKKNRKTIEKERKREREKERKREREEKEKAFSCSVLPFFI